MRDKKNEVEHAGLKIKLEYAKNFQNFLKRYRSLRLLNEPIITDKYIKYSFGGNGKDMNGFEKLIFDLNYQYTVKENKKQKSFWERVIIFFKG